MVATDGKTALFLDFEVDGHRVIIFPAWLKASLIGHPDPADQRASVRWLDNQPPAYTTDNPGRICQEAIIWTSFGISGPADIRMGFPQNLHVAAT